MPDASQDFADRLLRGGSFYDLEDLARCAIRDNNFPDLHNVSMGFGVVASPIHL